MLKSFHHIESFVTVTQYTSAHNPIIAIFISWWQEFSIQIQRPVSGKSYMTNCNIPKTVSRTYSLPAIVGHPIFSKAFETWTNYNRCTSFVSSKFKTPFKIGWCPPTIFPKYSFSSSVLFIKKSCILQYADKHNTFFHVLEIQVNSICNRNMPCHSRLRVCCHCSPWRHHFCSPNNHQINSHTTNHYQRGSGPLFVCQYRWPNQFWNPTQYSLKP